MTRAVSTAPRGSRRSARCRVARRRYARSPRLTEPRASTPSRSSGRHADASSSKSTEVRRPIYSPTGHLIYERRTRRTASGIWAVPFSIARLEVTGEPFLISQGGEPSIARDGTLAFDRQGGAPLRQLAWFTLDGIPGARIADPRQWTEGVAISKDSRRVIATTSEGLWIFDAETGNAPASHRRPGRHHARVDRRQPRRVRAHRGGETVLMLKQLQLGPGDRPWRGRRGFRARPPTAGASSSTSAWTGRAQWQIAWIDFDQPQEIKRLGGMHVGARFPSVSPDGTLVAYVSGEIGRDEIFLTQLPSGEGKYQISTAGGGWTLFSPRGDTLVYRSIDDGLRVGADSRRLQARPRSAWPEKRSVGAPGGRRTTIWRRTGSAASPPCRSGPARCRRYRSCRTGRASSCAGSSLSR